MPQSYTPSDKVLEKYARLLVHFGMQTRSGKKLKKGSVVQFDVPEVARPLYFHLQKEILKAGYHPLGQFIPSDTKEYNFSEAFFKYANASQRRFFPADFQKARIETIAGRIVILADTLPGALKNIEPKLVGEKMLSQKKIKDWFFEKVDAGKMSWTLGLYGTDALAKEAGLTLKEYWTQIIKACYLDLPDPVAKWREINKTVQATAKKLSAMKIESLHVTGPDVDLTVGLGANRAWRAGGGNNIPSYEVFTSPDYRRVNGRIRFNQPLYNKFGTLITGVELTFKDGACVNATAEKNQDSLREIMKSPGANRLGEFSLTDARLSRVTKFMANTLYDENVGGKYGNMHVAIGSAYRDCFQGKDAPTDAAGWDALGYNDSVVHEDIVSTTNRTVVATLTNGKQVIIYKNGRFILE
jgi:aminopeptidase